MLGLVQDPIRRLAGFPFQFVGESDRACFSVGGKSCSLDYESRAAHRLVFRVRDSGDPPATAFFEKFVNVTDVNDKPTGIRLEPPGITENSIEGEHESSCLLGSREASNTAK